MISLFLIDAAVSVEKIQSLATPNFVVILVVSFFTFSMCLSCRQAYGLLSSLHSILFLAI